MIQSEHRDELKKKLESEQIGYAIHYPNSLPFVEAYQYKKNKKGGFKNAERLCQEILSIPMYAELNLKQKEAVVSVNS